MATLTRNKLEAVQNVFTDVLYMLKVSFEIIAVKFARLISFPNCNEDGTKGNAIKRN